MHSVYAFLCCALLVLSTAAAWSPDCAPCKCRLTDGLRTVNCYNKELTSVPVFPSDTQAIDIKGGNISSLKATEFDTYLQLTSIDIQDNHFTILPIGLFSKTRNLISINFNYNKLKILHTHLFANLIYLESVWITGNQITVLEDNCFFNVPKLNKLNLARNHLSNININFVTNLNSLQYLYFDHNPVHCDYNICELMNRVVQHRMYKEDIWMPKCASPASVQNKTWAEAVGALWGTGLEHCPHRATVVEMNRTVKALQEDVRVVKELVSTGTEEMHRLKDAVVQLLTKSHALFMEEFNKTMSEVRSELGHVKNGQLQLQNKMYNVKDKVNVVKDGQQKLKDSVDVLMRQHEQVINRTDTLQSPNILFKEVLHVRGTSSGRGFLQLLYSILPAPRITTTDL